MRTKRHLAPIIAAFLVVASANSAPRAEPLRIAYGTWVGFGPLFVAEEKGFFAEEGVAVELIRIDEHTAAFAALADDQVNALAVATQDLVTYSARFAEPDDEPLVCVLAFDVSKGGDGILATNDVQSIAELEGRSVAVLRQSAAHFYLNALLQEAGLSEDDVEIVDLPTDDATTAFLLGEVDAVATYEPFLTQGKKAERGHLLIDTSEDPGLLSDCLVVKAGVLDQRAEAFRAVAHAWDADVHFGEENPKEANRIMARNLGDWLEDPATLVGILVGIEFYDAKKNREYFGSPEKPGPIYETVQDAIDVWSNLGVLEREVEPGDFIAHGVWDK